MLKTLTACFPLGKIPCHTMPANGLCGVIASKQAWISLQGSSSSIGKQATVTALKQQPLNVGFEV